MMGYELDVAVEELNQETGIISLKGDISGFADRLIYDAYNQLTRNGIHNIIFNFSKEDIIGTPGMAVLIDVIVQASQRHQNLLMAVPSSHFQRVFSMIGITQYAAIFDSLEEAKNQLFC